MTRQTKNDLLAEIAELKAEIEEIKRKAADDIACVVQANIEEQSILTDRLDTFLANIRDAYPCLHKSLEDAIAGKHYWIDDPPTGTVTAKIPRAALYVRWVFADGSLEFEYPNISGAGTYWSTPLFGEINEVL